MKLFANNLFLCEFTLMEFADRFLGKLILLLVIVKALLLTILAQAA